MDSIQGIKVGSKWEQITVVPDPDKPGKKRELRRVIEVTGKPTLSSPVNYRIVQHDARPHRVGKHGSIRRFDLHRKYRAVA